jgi:spore coat polysaccharide biosynthesis predicted glycosyltransferase SpsG
VPHVDVEWLIDRVRAPLVVFDLLLESHRDAEWLVHLRDRNIKVATLHEHVLPWADVDLAVSPTIFEQAIESTVPPSRISLQGAPYLLVDAAYGEPPQVARQPNTVAVVMGGADPANLRLDIVNRLCRDPRFDGWRIAVVQGPAMSAPDWTADPRIDLLEQPGSLVHLFQEASIAITNGGTACYEAIAAGCMVYATPQNDFEDEVIALLITQRLCQLWPPIRWEDGRLPPDDRGGIDGHGVSRVAEAIIGLIGTD